MKTTTHHADVESQTIRVVGVVSRGSNQRSREVVSISPLSKCTPVRNYAGRGVLGIVLVLASLLYGSTAIAQSKSKVRPAVVPAVTQNSFSVEIVPVADSPQLRVLTPERGALDLGTVSATGQSNPTTSVRKTSKSMIVTSEFALRVRGNAGDKAQPVTINGFITHATTAQRFRINGQSLSVTPLAIARNVPIGTVTRHRLEIEIPYASTEADANVNVSLGFTVSTN